jgi:hypothetical protein
MEDSLEVIVDEQLHELATPLRERLAEVDQRITELQEKTSSLREARKRIMTTLRALDPESVPAQAKQTSSGLKPSETKVAEIREFLESHRAELNGPGFSSHDLLELDDWNGIASHSYTAVILRVLHDRGVLRLDRVATTGRKIYKLV